MIPIPSQLWPPPLSIEKRGLLAWVVSRAHLASPASCYDRKAGVDAEAHLNMVMVKGKLS